MTDRVPGAPGQYKMVITPEQFAKMQQGESAVVTMTRDDHPITIGTPYSKATILPDEVAKTLCPDTLDPTPADAFKEIGFRTNNHIVVEGTSGGWWYRKWSNGNAECWSSFRSNLEDISEAWGSGFVGCTKYAEPYPFTFTEPPIEVVTGTTQYYHVITLAQKANTSETTGMYAAYRPTSALQQIVRYNFYVSGKWK